MTFKQIVWKMAKFHYKKYIFYFPCNSFAVMFFFMFSTVYFNERVVQGKKVDGTQDALAVPAVALIVFTVFFISYAHNVFIKRRRSEFGLFMTLGMSKRDISKLLLLENGVIGLLAIISGILTGAIISRLFFFLLMASVGLPEISFHLNTNMFVYSIATFMVVFFAAVGKSLFQTLKGNLIYSLKSDKVAEINKMKSPMFGGIGLVIVIGSLLILYFTYAKSSSELLYLWTIFLFMGLYISLHQFVRTERVSEDELFQVSSKVVDYNLNKSSSGILFFVIIFLSIIFFFGTFVLLYLNLFSEMDREKAKYKKLYKIGITVQEVKRIISQELMTLFFVPTILGTLLAFIYVVILATDVGGIMKNPEILTFFIIIAGIYIGIQAGYFFFARRKMLIHLTN